MISCQGGKKLRNSFHNKIALGAQLYWHTSE